MTRYNQGMTARQITGFALIGIGVGAGTLWVSGRVTHPFTPVLTLIFLLAGASCFGKTSRFAEKLRPLIGKSVRVWVWGSELHDTAGATFKVVRVQALGAGLHLYLRPLPDGPSTHLKVAQPLETTIREAAVEIRYAKYIQWAGRKVKKTEQEKALVLSVAAKGF